MKFYRVNYQIAANGEFQYPAQVRNVVWSNAHYHNTERFMVAEAEGAVAADGRDVVELTQAQARALIEEVAKSYPPPPKEERQAPPTQR
jgi:hypothetical protein